MKKFVKKIIVFFIPLFLYLIIVVIIDPYNFFSNSNFIPLETKKEISFKLNYPLFKLLAFKKKPTKNIILGDSRTNNLDINFINECAGKEFTNLAFGGGTLQEIINTFWEATKETKLEKVVIGLNFNLYNKVNAMDRVSEAVYLKNNFLSYGTSKFVFKSTGLIIKNLILNSSFDLGIPEMSREEFWQYQLNSAANNTYRIYNYPQGYFLELKKIAEYCKNNKIELKFFIPPTHTSLQEKIHEFKLLKEEEKFKEDIKRLASVYDFDFSNQITRNKEKFKDPYHCKESVAELVAKVIFCENPEPDLIDYFVFYENKKE
ncbi:hypothetical protein [uncultured Maribacter sp.]|uniref:hypothetical protein n=1 Tax=uncultured Maribacter sp. TaxID=431308 RepID=UPI00262ECB88|nr:hypothetical protein [uncultured Maribacter sp.]